MKHTCKRIAVTLMAIMLLICMMPATTFAASKKPTPGKVTLSKISAPAYNKIKISWKKTSNATNYVVYYKKAGTSKWKKLTTVASSKTSYTHTSSKKYPIIVGQKYSYTVRAYNKTSKKYGKYNTKGLTTKTLPSTVKLKSAKLNSKKTAVTVSWSKAKGCNYYRIYRKTPGKSWTRIATVKSSKVSYTDKNPVKGVTNAYTVRAYYSKTKALSKYNKTGVSATVPAPTVKVTSVSLNQTSAMLTAKGQTVTLKATVSPSNATNKSVTWKSSNANVATVNNGIVTAVSNGTAKITATAADGSGKSASCNVTVNIPAPVVKVSNISLNKTSATLTAKGQTVTLSATVSPSNAANKAVTWSSSNANVATVQNGIVTAVSNGTAKITATAADGSGKSASCTVTVNIPAPTPEIVKVSSVSLNKTAATLTAKGQTVDLSASVSPSNATNKVITWSSSDTSVATVNASGKVTAVANGTAKITATANDGSGKSASCSVTVNIPEPVEPTPEPTPSVPTTNISLAGGKNKICSIFPNEVTSDTNLKNIAFEFKGNTNCIDIASAGYAELNQSSRTTIKGLKSGTVQVIAKYNGTVLKIWNVTVTSNWDTYMEFEAWKNRIEPTIWKNGMTITEKLLALQNYIRTNFTYGNCANGYTAHKVGYVDCIGASDLFGLMAKDLGVKVGYVNISTGQVYDFLSDAVGVAGNHISNAVLINNEWVGYDAQPLH